LISLDLIAMRAMLFRKIVIPLQSLATLLLLLGFYYAGYPRAATATNTTVLALVWLVGAFAAAVAFRTSPQGRFLSGAVLGLNCLGLLLAAIVFWIGHQDIP
jgi:ABC-type enterochelin transport system permease subunit